MYRAKEQVMFDLYFVKYQKLQGLDMAWSAGKERKFCRPYFRK
ncbi:hypothetical protein FM107_10450 [Sphingobacterium sp. JB170]|nr:hypothetical protein FM107_10450 [Sphingobacterium sp. JB170]